MVRSSVRAFDHFVIAVRDAQRAGELYERLGFHVLPLMRHIELGSCNRIVQLQDTYLELLGDLEKSVPAVQSRLMPRLSCGEGLALVCLSSSDLEQDRAHAASVNLDPTPIFSARRAVVMPDGTTDETDSECFYMWRTERLCASLFLCRHHKPETIWIPQYQTHRNSARRVIAVSYISDDPALELDYVSRVLGAPPASSDAHHLAFETARGERLEYLSPGRARERFAALAPEPCPSQPSYGIAMRIEVADLDRCRSQLRDGGIEFEATPGGLRVSPRDACGVRIEFSR